MLDDVYENPTLEMGKYKQAVEKVLAELPVENGVITLESLWLELTLPEDLLVEILTGDELILPLNVDKVVSKDGRVLAEKKEIPVESNGAGETTHLDTGT